MLYGNGQWVKTLAPSEAQNSWYMLFMDVHPTKIDNKILIIYVNNIC
jgi:hypothetical protein